MHEHGLARELWPQLQRIAQSCGLKRVTCVEMTVGVFHGVSAEMLEHSFQHAFEGSSFQGAAVRVTVVEPGDEVVPSHSTEETVATGWELLISRLEGDE